MSVKYKSIILVVLFLFIGFVSVSAFVPLPRGGCNWTREYRVDWGNPLIDQHILIYSYRPEQSFIGVYGRLSNGSITCFSPGRSHFVKPIVGPVVPFVPVCVSSSVCDSPVCHVEKFCDVWGYRCGIKRCLDWDYRNLCDTPVCHTISSCTD